MVRVVLGSFSSHSLKETKLQRHLESKHKQYLEKDHEFFESKKQHVKRSRVDRPSI